MLRRFSLSRFGQRSQSRKTGTSSSSQRNWKRIGLENLEARMMLSGGSILSTLWDDANANGLRDGGENPLENWTVYVDANNNGSLDAGELSAVTDKDGEAKINGIPEGIVSLREIVPAGYAPSPGFSDQMDVEIFTGETFEALFLNHTAQVATINGSVWNDYDNDGTRNFDEPGLAGWELWLDLNSDEIQDPTEPTTVSDEFGNFTFENAPVGNYKVYENLPLGWEPTLFYDNKIGVDLAAHDVVNVDFGNFLPSAGAIDGSVWNDLNGNSVHDIGEDGIAGQTVYIDNDNSGDLSAGDLSTVTDASGLFNFPFVTEGNYTVRSELPAGWEWSPGYDAAGFASVTAGVTSNVQFARFEPVPGSISGKIFNDVNSNGSQDLGELGLQNWTVFADVDGSGTLTAGDLSAVTDTTGSYQITGVAHGPVMVIAQTKPGFIATNPGTGAQYVSLLNGENLTAVEFGFRTQQINTIAGVAFVDANKNGSRDAGEKGLPGLTVFLDVNDNGSLDAGEPSIITSEDLYYTPAVDEAGTYTFDHLAAGVYKVVEILPDKLSATPAANRSITVTLNPGESKLDADFANVYRASEIRGVRYDDVDGDNVRDLDESVLPGQSLYLDLDRDEVQDEGEPTTVTGADGSYAFTGLTPGAYVVREVLESGHKSTVPTTGGTLWPAGTSNPAIGNVDPTSITLSLSNGQVVHQSVSLTLPTTGALTNMVDVFLLFDDTGSFTGNSPIVRAAFPEIIAQLQASLPGLNLGFGVGRFEEYANFASEFATGRPFILNQSIVSTTTTGFDTAIANALNRTTPGYGGDGPETLIEALYQVVTGRGFDGNNNGTTSDSGAAGLANTQLNPGSSGDVPAFSSYTADTANGGLPAQGTIGGVGFRSGALPIILAATDIGFAFQPKGETSITGLNGLTLPLSSFTQTSRNTTPYSSGAGIQETITGLNALGALVIGLGTNADTTVDPRQDLSSISRMTGATNQTTTTIANGTATPIAPGDPFYFQIASGFSTSVANGVVAAIQNAVTNVAVNVTLRASDPNVKIITNPGVINGLGSGETATFDVEFTGDGVPRRFDLQFVRAGTNVVLGSIPVVLGTPIPGDGYSFEELEDGEIEVEVEMGSKSLGLPTSIESATATPSVVTVGGSVSVTANNVTAGSGATLASVSFYRDANANGLFDDGVDPVIGTDANGTDGWSTSALTDATWGLSATSLFARALDSLGNWSAPVSASVYLNAKPVVNSFSVAPAPTLPTSNLTLKATSVTDANLDGTVTSVSFYRDVNNNGKFESALDTLISTDTDSSDGFTADYSITNAPTGTLRFFAIATDDQGASSTAKLGLVSVTQKPVVGSLSASTDLLSRGASLTLTANDVSDPDGSVASVEFWLDRNNSGLIDTGDLRVGVDSKPSDGWGLTFLTTNLAIGPNQLLARAIDKVKMIGDAVGTTVTTDAPPTLSKVVASPAAITPEQSVTLTASGASVDTSAVNFYLDNGDGKFGLGDTLLSTDTDGSDGWTNTTSAAGLALGKNVFFAQAVDPIGGLSLARSTYTKVSTAPQILGSFTATPNPVSKGQNLNLSVTDITDDGSVASVLFYRDVDNDGQATAVDKLLGSDSNGLDGWSINLNSASTNLVSGINRLLAVAKDNLGLKSAPVLTLVDVNAPPAISSFSASLTKATTLQSIKFTVKSSVDTTGVDLFLDNGDGLFDATTDSLLASPSKDIVTGNWIYTAPAGSLPIGSLKLWARATDGLGYSIVRSINVVIS